jgi:hypothetical protein
MTSAALISEHAEVVLTKPGTEALGSIEPVLSTAVAAHTTDRVEPDAAVRAVGQHIVVDSDAVEGDAGVAGTAIVTHHGLMDAVEGASPVRAAAERNVGRDQET